ncbi:addiction module toxin, HicA family [Candidatus Scalindua japonica]|uniref:addiction module toxin, HicA family n=1 Tax=Candidatus Scalindua japonica TaxID=1284222 RepID=UPI000BDF6B46|nr:addiction module toxin, HicA family [Candidatus Scalindua japonica]
MKRKKFISWLHKHGVCVVIEGRRHTIFGKGKLKTEIPRHNEIVDLLASKICKDLEIQDWRNK